MFCLFCQPMTVEDFLLVFEKDFSPSRFTKLAMFDLDNTIATYNNIETIAVWSFMFPNVRKKLFELHQQNYKIVILSNQSQITSKEIYLKNFKAKIEEILRILDIPTLVLVAIKKDKFRKPNIGAYQWLKNKYFSSVELEDAFYVGDAAGSRKGAKYNAKADLYFAKNSGLKFYLPEEYFLNEKPNYNFHPIDIRTYKNDSFVKKDKRIIFIYGLKKYCGKLFFSKKFYPEHKVFYNCDYYSKDCVYINCNNLEFINMIKRKHPNDYHIYILDYPERVEQWLKGFYFINGQYKEKPFVSVSSKTLKFLKSNAERVPFSFDDENYNEEERVTSYYYIE